MNFGRYLFTDEYSVDWQVAEEQADGHDARHPGHIGIKFVEVVAQTMRHRLRFPVSSAHRWRAAG